VCAPHPQQGPIPAFEGYGESGLLTQEALKEEIKQSIRLMVSTRPAWGKYLDPRLLTAARRTPEQEAAAARQEATRVERLAGGAEAEAEADEDTTQPSASPASVLAESGTPHRPSQASTIVPSAPPSDATEVADPQIRAKTPSPRRRGARMARALENVPQLDMQAFMGGASAGSS